MRIAVCNLKGGAGKTTTAVYVALGLARRTGGRVVLVDADPGQPQAQKWAASAGESWPASVEVVSRVTRSLANQLRKDADDADHLVVDIGPKNPHMLREAVEVASELIIPTIPRVLDLDGVRLTVGACAGVRNTVYPRVLFVQARAKAKLRESRELVESWQIDAFGSAIRELERYADAPGTVPNDLIDYDAVLDELLKEAI